MQITSWSVEKTEYIAETIGRALKGGEVIELVSDLGGGKTTFTRGLAKGLGISGVVSSPTFTISREYEGRLKLYHFDFYRLGEAGIMSDEFAEAVGDPGGIVVVEWADVIAHVLPEDRLRIFISAPTETSRSFDIQVPEDLQYTLGGLS
jgi:tRNA threonylcarbamoyladenosine biosynthesis protein TsaE